MAVTSPVSERWTVAALLLLTFATGLADSISILALGHVFVANMTGNVIFLGFWLAPSTTIDLTAVAVALPTFICTTILSGRLARHFGIRTRTWITTVLATEIVLLVALAILAGTGMLRYQGNSKLIMIGILAVTFGLQHSSARRVRHSGAVHYGADVDDRQPRAGQPPCRRDRRTPPAAHRRGRHHVRRRLLRCDDVEIRDRPGVRGHRGGDSSEPADLPVRASCYENYRGRC